MKDVEDQEDIEKKLESPFDGAGADVAGAECVTKDQEMTDSKLASTEKYKNDPKMQGILALQYMTPQ